VMTRSKNPGRPDRAHDIESLAIDDGDTFVCADVKELLLRVGRQRQIPCKWRLGPDQLLYELAVVGKHLDASVLPICQVHHPIVGHAKRMRDIEMRGALGIGKGLRRNDRTAVLAAWRLAKGAPHPLERPSVRVEDDDAVIAVTIRYEQFVGWRMHPGVGGAMHIDRVSIALALVAFANLQHESAVARELQVRVIGDGFEPSEPRGWAIVPAHPDKALVVDMDAVFALGPVISACLPAPSLDE